MATFPNAKCEYCGIELKGVINDYGNTWVCRDCKIENDIHRTNLSILHAVAGDKVIVTDETVENGYSCDSQQVKELIDIGYEYTVKSINIGRSSSRLVLEEFPNKTFNAVNFIRCENQ